MASSGTLPPEFDRGVVTTVHQGDCHVSDAQDITFSTILGSCISACVRDIHTGVGGMNHFLLPQRADDTSRRYGASARYGAYAMELLINKVLSRGSGAKANLEIKLFGGGLINAALGDVGAQNVTFVREFLKAEGYRPIGVDVGGSYARRVLYKPDSGRAFVRRLDNLTAASVVREEIVIAGMQHARTRQTRDIELF